MTYEPAASRYDAMVVSRLRAGAASACPCCRWACGTTSATRRRWPRSGRSSRAAFDAGITHFDLANNYGPPYGAAEINFGRILREDLAAHRDEILISSKAGWDMWPGPYGQGGGSRKYVLASLDQSLRRVGRGVLRHLLLAPLRPGHAARGDDGRARPRGPPGQGAVRRDLVLLGRARPARWRRSSRRGRPAADPPAVSYNLFNRWVEPELLDALEELGGGMIAFTALAQGLLTDKYLGGIPAERPDQPAGR